MRGTSHDLLEERSLLSAVPTLAAQSAALAATGTSSPADAQAEQAGILTASDGLASNNLGTSVAVSGDVVVVGAPGREPPAMHRQAMERRTCFENHGAGWSNMTELAKLTASDGASDDFFGSSVAISGNTIVTRHGANQGQGKAYVFVEPTGGWRSMTQTAELTASEGASSGGFGTSVAISGDTIVVESWTGPVAEPLTSSRLTDGGRGRSLCLCEADHGLD